MALTRPDSLTTPLTYCIVSPVRDEARFLQRTAESIISQTHRPAQWVIVDDGSTDGTTDIARRLAKAYPWISVVERERQGGRARGAPVVRAFNAGQATLKADHEVVVKLDGDLLLPSHYFYWVMMTFAGDSRAGVVGGLLQVPATSGWEYDSLNQRTVHGAVKAYRSSCLTDIGGLPESMGWDGIDEYAALARGWGVHVLSELTVLHYASRGSKQDWKEARREEGRANHYMGYSWSFMAARVGYQMLRQRPSVLAGLWIGASFVWERIRRTPQCPDRLAVDQLRAEQRQRLLALVRFSEPPPRCPPPALLAGRDLGIGPGPDVGQGAP